MIRSRSWFTDRLRLEAQLDERAEPSPARWRGPLNAMPVLPNRNDMVTGQPVQKPVPPRPPPVPPPPSSAPGGRYQGPQEIAWAPELPPPWYEPPPRSDAGDDSPPPLEQQQQPAAAVDRVAASTDRETLGGALGVSAWAQGEQGALAVDGGDDPGAGGGGILLLLLAALLLLGGR